MWPASAFCESSVEAAGNKPWKVIRAMARVPAGGARASANSRLEGGRESRPGAEEPKRRSFPPNGLDLWYKPFIRLFLRWSRLGAHGPDLLDPAQRFPQLSQPGVLMLPDQSDAPGQCVTPAAGHPGVHEGIEHPAL